MASERRPEKPPARHRSGRRRCALVQTLFFSSGGDTRDVHPLQPIPTATTTTTTTLKAIPPLLGWTPDNIGRAAAAQLSGVPLRAFGASPSIYTHTDNHHPTESYFFLSSSSF